VRIDVIYLIFRSYAETNAGLICGNNNFKIISVSHKDLIGIKTPTQSQNSKKYKDIDCFCEAVALKTAGENSKIIQKREISDDRLATIAIAGYE